MKHNIKHIIAPRGSGKTTHAIEAIRPYKLDESLYLVPNAYMYRMSIQDYGMSPQRVMTLYDLINGGGRSKDGKMKYVIVDEFLSTAQLGLDPNLVYDNILSLLRNSEGSELVLYSTPMKKFDKSLFSFLRMHGCTDAPINNIFLNFLSQEDKDKMWKEMVQMKLSFLDPSEVNIVLTDFGRGLNDYEKARRLHDLGKERYEVEIEAKFLY